MNWAFHAGSPLYGQLHQWQTVLPNKGGRWEYGPGVYMSRDYYVLQPYYRGSRALWLILWEGTHIEKAPDFYQFGKDLRDLNIFLSKLPKNTSEMICKELIRYFNKNNRTPILPLFVFLNLIVNAVADNRNVFPLKKTPMLAEFLSDHGGDWGGEIDKICNIWNPKAIKYVIKVPGKLKYWEETEVLKFIQDQGVTL